MNTPCTVFVWDDDASRGLSIERMLLDAFAAQSIQVMVVLHSEPPLLARNGFSGRTPAIQYENLVFQHTGTSIDADSIHGLVALICKQYLRC